MYGWMGEWVDTVLKGWLNVRVDGRMGRQCYKDGWLNVRVDGRMGRYSVTRMDG